MNKGYAAALAGTIMDRFADPDSYPYRSWSYSQGFMLWGFIRLYEYTGNTSYRDYVLRYCEEHVDAEGNIAGFSGVSLDDIMTGSVLIWAFQETGEQRYRLACDRIRKVFDDYPRNANGGFWHGKQLPGEMWVDGLFMGLMFLTRYGAVIGDSEYCFSESVRQLNIVFECCEKDHTGLLYHAYSENPEPAWVNPVSGNSPEIWSEGLGWYAMMLAEALELIPEGTEGRDSLVRQMQALARGLALCIDPVAHLWFQVVDKPRTKKNWHDTSGTAMFLYALHKALRLGALEEKYAGLCDLAFDGLKSKCLFDLDGHMNVYDACDGLGVQTDYDSYMFFPRTVNAKEAVAAVLWACTEMEYEK